MSLFGSNTTVSRRNGTGRHEVHEIHPEPIDFDARPAREKEERAQVMAEFMERPKPIKLNTLDEIARLLRTAEYGEMMDLAVALQKMMETQGADNIAKILHMWATSRV